MDLDAGESGRESLPVELEGGSIRTAELHWYEAHGIGHRHMKIKKLLP